MHDYFSDYLYINQAIRDSVLGDIDLDGNGVVFGDDFIQIGNGYPPPADAELAHYMNGIFYELYPNNCRHWTDRDGLLCLLSSLVAGCRYTEMQGSYVFSGWTLDVEPGAPTGPAVIEGSVDGILTVRRPFQNGEVKLSFYDTGRRLEYAFLPSSAPAP
jgi:hypothetical protein